MSQKDIADLGPFPLNLPSYREKHATWKGEALTKIGTTHFCFYSNPFGFIFLQGESLQHPK